jgi:LEA14-like dessication related protein
MFWGLGLGVLVWAGYRAWNMNESIKFFQYSFSGVKFSMNGLSPVATITLNVYNPNRTGVPINDVFGVIKAPDGGILANFKNVSPIQLAGNETATIQLRCTINALAVVLKIIRGTKTPHVNIEAMLKTGVFDMPLKSQVSTIL